MSADWYFLKKGFFGRRKKVGPVSDVELRHYIEKGIIQPETMVSSEIKTHGHWCRMKEIPAAMTLWDKSHPKEV